MSTHTGQLSKTQTYHSISLWDGFWMVFLPSKQSDAVVVRVPLAGLSHPISHKKGDGTQRTYDDQDEQLPVQQQVVTVEEGHGRRDGLDELEDSEGGGAVVPEDIAHDAEELCVEAAVAQTEQEAAEQCHPHAGGDVSLQICARLRSQRSITGNVEENQVECNKVSDESQQHHRVPPKTVVFVQNPKHTSSYDLAEADANARDTNQTLCICAEARHGSDTRPVHPAVKGELQACVSDGDAEQQHLFGDKHFTGFDKSVESLRPEA